MKQFIKYAGLDTHKETIAGAIADATSGNRATTVKFPTRPPR